MTNTPINDLSPLSNHKDLWGISCSGAKVQDLYPLKYHIATKKLNVFLEPGGRGGIFVQNCPLTNPPLEIAQQGNAAILRYWERLESGNLPLNEAKIILLGKGAAGKTTLVKRLFKERFSKKQSQTNGVLIRKRGEMVGDEFVTLRYWDFGGQEIMHATHKFFLSQRAIYMVVLDARKEEDQAEYWLEHVRTYGGNSKVLVVVNQVDENPSFQLNQRGLENKYGDRLAGFHRISCKSGEGIPALKQAILNLVAADEFVSDPIPTDWRKLKDKVEEMSDDYVSYDAYRKFCTEGSVADPQDQAILLRLLHDLGIALHFDQLQKYNTSVLNPEWLTTAVYRVLNSKLAAANGGKFEAEDLERYLNDAKYPDPLPAGRYPQEKFHYIAEAMEAFQLCYRLPERSAGRTQFLIPGLLAVEEPETQWTYEREVKMELRYPNLVPPSILPRLIVAMHPWVVEGKAWRTGVQLAHLDWETEALVRLDTTDRTLRIAVRGSQNRRLLTFIRETLRKLNSEFAHLEAEEWVPLEKGEDFVKYADLVWLEEMGDQHYTSPKLKKRFPLDELLDGVEDKERRNARQPDPVRIFISYAAKNLDGDGSLHKDHLVTHLSAYTHTGNVTVWEDGCILPGEDREQEKWDRFHEADIVLSLVSANYLQTDICSRGEYRAAIAQMEEGKKDVIPIIVEACQYKQVETIGMLKEIPTKAVGQYTNANDAWNEVVAALDPIISKWLTKKANTRHPKGFFANDKNMHP